MFDFLSSDWFIITLEVMFLLLIIYDVRRYLQTGKKEYVTNIVLTIVFFVWAAVPFYNSYITWTDLDKKEYFGMCQNQEHNATLCGCIANEIYKEFSHKSFDTNTSEYKEFYHEIKEDCLDDDSWF